MKDDPHAGKSVKVLDVVLDIACPDCGARTVERCSDVEVFVRDTAFQPEHQKKRLDPR